jgi:hypothetical protein
VSLFVHLVERVGTVVSSDVGMAEHAKQGGLAVMLAVVEIFERLLGSELSRDDPTWGS